MYTNEFQKLNKTKEVKDFSSTIYLPAIQEAVKAEKKVVAPTGIHHLLCSNKSTHTQTSSYSSQLQSQKTHENLDFF